MSAGAFPAGPECVVVNVEDDVGADSVLTDSRFVFVKHDLFLRLGSAKRQEPGFCQFETLFQGLFGVFVGNISDAALVFDWADVRCVQDFPGAVDIGFQFGDVPAVDVWIGSNGELQIVVVDD